MNKVYKFHNSAVKLIPFDNFLLDRLKPKKRTVRPAAKEGTVIVHCYKPNEKTIEELSKILEMEIQEVKELLEEGVRPRIELDDAGNLIIVYRAPFYEEVDEIVTAPVSFLIKGKVLFIISNHKITSIDRIFKKLEMGRKTFLFKRHIGYALYYFLDKINDEYIYIMNKIADSSELIKEKDAKLTRKSIEHIDSLNTTLIYFNRSLLGNAEVATMLKKSQFPALRKFNREYFADLYFDSLQLLDTEKIQRDVITSMFNFQNALSSYELNRFMKRLTTLAVIIAIPTLLTSAYGMNFKVIPLQNHPYGFYITTFVIFLLTIPAIYIFKKLDNI
jgi:magnesium transporter